jgi:hypothetical protein
VRDENLKDGTFISMVFEIIYLLREAVKSVAQNEVHISIESLRGIIKKLLDVDKIAIYSSETGLDEDLKALQKLSFLTVSDGKIIINREAFLNATKFVERQEELLKDDRYATAILKRLKQRAREIRPLQQVLD